MAALYGHTEIVKILAPLTNSPIAPNKYGFTPISAAAQRGHTEIVKILAPDNDGRTPIYWAALTGRT